MRKTYLFFMLILVAVVFFIFIDNEKEVQIKTDNLEIENQSPNEKDGKQFSLVEWRSISGVWEPSSTPPECPDLIYYSPIDLSLATSVLYPGQYRDEYKPHGGFRFDKQKTSDIEVRAPFNGYVWRGARYFVSGEIQYTVEIVNECGIIHRLGHLLELSPEFNLLAQKLPEPKELDSRLYPFEEFISVQKGDLIATKVGVSKNVFMDWGVYDLRKENDASKNTSYREKHQNARDSAFFAICWIEFLPEDQKEIVMGLPAADSISGKESDYC